MENCWEHLEIEPTSDTAAIKKAYAKLLKHNKPDKNPEGFRNLRAAYEQALNESWWYEEEEESEEEIAENDGAEHKLSEEVTLVESDFVFSTILDSTIVETENAELSKITQIQIENEEINYDNAAEVYALAEAIEKESAELLSHLEQSTIEENSLERSDQEDQDFEEFNFEEDDLEQETFTPYYYASSQWSDEWQKICNERYSKATSRDFQLRLLVQSQLETSLSLDEQNEFEEELLVWLADQEPLFPLSYQLAKDYFQWDKRLEHWSHNQYPWYRLDSLDQNYQQVAYFDTPYDFYSYLAQYFPTVASHLSIVSLSESEKEYIKPVGLERIDLFKPLFFPFRVAGLAQELKALDAELEYYINDHHAAIQLTLDKDNTKYKARYWQKESALNMLNGWIFNRFIQLKDFFILAIIIATLFGSAILFFNQSWQSYSYDGLGVFVVLTLYYLFWQLQLSLFVTPEKLFSLEPWNTGWRNASVLFFILGYISWIDIADSAPLIMYTSPVYMLTNLAGASLFAASSMRQSNIVVTVITWYAGLLLLVLTVLIPLVVYAVAQPPYTDIEAIPISPLFWLLLTAPAFFVSLGDAYPRFERVANIGYKLLTIWHYLMLVGIFLIYAYCADELLEISFGFTALTIMMLTIVMAIGLTKYLKSFDES